MRRIVPLSAPAATLLLAALAAVLLGGCGRRGALEPAGTVETPTRTPNLVTVPIGTPAEEPPPVEKPDRPFVLDPLL